MPRQEELELALRDSITPGLKAIAKELRELNRAAKEAAGETSDNIDKISKSTQNYSDKATAALRSLEAMSRSAVNMGKSIVGIGGTTEALNLLSKSINDLATTRIQLSNFATDTRFTAQNISVMREAMERMGIDTKQADTYIGNLSTKLQELRALREGSQLFRDLQLMGSGGTDLAKKLQSAVDVGDYKAAVEEVVKTYQQQSPRAQFYLSQMLQVPQSVLEQWAEYNAKSIGQFQGSTAAAKEWHNNWVTRQVQMKNEWDDFNEHVMERGNEVFEYFKKNPIEKGTLSKFFIDEFDAIDKGIQTTIREIQAIKKFLEDLDDFYSQTLLGKMLGIKTTEEKTRDAADEKKNVGGSKSRFEGAFTAVEEMRLQQENNKTLKEIRDRLTPADEGTGAAGSAESAGGYGAGIRQAGGAARAALGGFRRGATGPSGGAASKYTGDANQPASVGGKIDRSRFAKEIENTPGLKEKMLGIAAGEQGTHPAGTTATLESMMNRAAMLKTTLAHEARTTAEGGYYVGYKPGALNDPKWKAQLESSYSAAMGGSNVSNYATDNASSWLAAKHKRTGDFETRSDIHGETFFAPGSRDAGRGRNRKNYEIWRKSLDDDAKNTVFDKGTASVTVDFNQNKNKAKEQQADGGVFKKIDNEREPQAPKSGGSGADPNDRWHFQ